MPHLHPHQSQENSKVTTEMYLFLCQDDNTQQLILKPLHGDGEVDDGGSCWHLRGVGGIAKLGGDVQAEPRHHVALLVTHFHLQQNREMAEIPHADVNHRRWQ